MATVVRLLGIEHREGFSKKKQKDYNFTALHVEHEPDLHDSGMIGRKVETLRVSSDFDYMKLAVEKKYRVVYDKDGFGNAVVSELLPA